MAEELKTLIIPGLGEYTFTTSTDLQNGYDYTVNISEDNGTYTITQK